MINISINTYMLTAVSKSKVSGYASCFCSSFVKLHRFWETHPRVKGHLPARYFLLLLEIPVWLRIFTDIPLCCASSWPLTGYSQVCCDLLSLKDIFTLRWFSCTFPPKIHHWVLPWDQSSKADQRLKNSEAAELKNKHWLVWECDPVV